MTTTMDAVVEAMLAKNRGNVDVDRVEILNTSPADEGTSIRVRVHFAPLEFDVVSKPRLSRKSKPA